VVMIYVRCLGKFIRADSAVTILNRKHLIVLLGRDAVLGDDNSAHVGLRTLATCPTLTTLPPLQYDGVRFGVLMLLRAVCLGRVINPSADTRVILAPSLHTLTSAGLTDPVAVAVLLVLRLIVRAVL
jgi:hypothetical protein